MSLIPGINSVIKSGVEDSVNNGIRSASSLIGSARNVVDAIRNPSNFMSSIRSVNLPKGGETLTRTATQATVVSNSSNRDWRVRLSVPTLSAFTGPLIAPLSDTGNAMIFPYTPTIIMSHTANYHGTNPTHSNYTYHNFVQSQVDQITITGEFVVENRYDGAYWIAVVHYLRSVTKMFYGQDANAGAPPPIVKLNGYGDYVFNNVPVVVQNFTIDLQPDVDYISVSVGGREALSDFDSQALLQNSNNGDALSWVPTRSTITVTLAPIYSRQTIEQFSLTSFVNGTYVTNGKGFI